MITQEKSVVKVIDSFIQCERDKNRSEGTLKAYSRILNEFNNWLNSNGGSIENITRIDVQQYIKSLELRNNSAVTIENKFAIISLFAKFLNRPEVVQHIRKPEHRKSFHTAPKSLERNERNRILREVEQSKNLRNVAIVNLLLCTGVRVSELAALNRDDITINERSGSVSIRNGKGNIARKVPLPVEARLHLTKYLNSRDDFEQALFISNYKKRITVRSVQRILEKYNVHSHQLRHTYCRELIGAGVDIVTVAELAGHADINVTRRYANPSFSELGQIIDKAFSL
ncbi:MAG: integrase-recombinase protein [uncultured bacterium]|nr:MAG: integrase-recombinase protein [uncultured bacterium]HBH18395.1 integrase [Cyanobacteria bacterium UBA9579]